ncbi:tRNA (adenosine(37)-N6)-threonylcarbamoyltransferase complex transferase subunit TsaD [Terricaulis silvestris]|uniref:tRNA N6-adenosine threonylcarbamoyltransferase n=1 Tax=Terricaulis silvestris TaxID=2686094 RepID=A0A6I6MKC3_9CAUL|nr:tRNA (adenosine(37)-N6)-threonylcarbamoyltransferase complex transferase subunit TsaD [Terricaulis silvestris]QGZ93576.1 t(6)A37 threonylcarbamoyladenosine biosynthesis protein [Terricaulis silvestris]
MGLVLGIETACDDTAAAVVDEDLRVRSSVVWGQKQTHEQFNGVVPELAARRHAEVILRVVKQALEEAGAKMSDLSAIAVNNQHGLIRSVVVGVAAARGLAYAQGVPLVPVHHVEAHVFSAIMTNPALFEPHICLAVAGGHNALIHVHSVGDYEVIGRTLDDSAGEAFDKVGSYLGLPFPAGAQVDKLARGGNPRAYDFPRPKLKDGSLNFSFSGLKTPVRMVAEKLQDGASAADVAASFERAVVDVLVAKTLAAAEQCGLRQVSVVGGVACNTLLREELPRAGAKAGIVVTFAPPRLCTDNAAMVAGLAQHKLREGAVGTLDLDATPNAPLGRRGANYRPNQSA